MKTRMIGALGIAAGIALAACQGSGAQGGGGGPYNPQNQPAVNPYGTPGPVEEGGRVTPSQSGPNAGVYPPAPPEGVRGSGSAYHSPPSAQPARPTPTP